MLCGQLLPGILLDHHCLSRTPAGLPQPPPSFPAKLKMGTDIPQQAIQLPLQMTKASVMQWLHTQRVV